MVSDLVTRCFAFGKKIGHPLFHFALYRTKSSWCTGKSGALFCGIFASSLKYTVAVVAAEKRHFRRVKVIVC